MKKALSVLLILTLILALAGCSSKPAPSTPADPNPSTGSNEVVDTKVDFPRLRIVIGSTSTGGDTYQSAEIIARYLQEQLGANTAVDPVGAARAFGELEKAKNDGSTMMFFHDMAYLGVEFGSYSQDFKLENWTVGPMVSTNPGNAFLAKHDAPFNTMKEAAEWLKANPNEKLSIAIEAGGVSEISFHAFYLWVEEAYGKDVSGRVRAFVTGSQKDKDQALWDGNVNIIHGSIASNDQYTKDGVDNKIKMKFLGITAAERTPGYDIPTFVEEGIKFKGNDFIFDKEFFFLLPKDVSPTFLAKLDKAVENVMKDHPQYEQELISRTFTKNYKSSSEAKEYVYQKRAVMQTLIQNAPKLDDITGN